MLLMSIVKKTLKHLGRLPSCITQPLLCWLTRSVGSGEGRARWRDWWCCVMDGATSRCWAARGLHAWLHGRGTQGHTWPPPSISSADACLLAAQRIAEHTIASWRDEIAGDVFSCHLHRPQPWVVYWFCSPCLIHVYWQYIVWRLSLTYHDSCRKKKKKKDRATVGM